MTLKKYIPSNEDKPKPDIETEYLRRENNRLYTEIAECHRTIGTLEYRILILKERLGDPPENKKPCIVVQFKK